MAAESFDTRTKRIMSERNCPFDEAQRLASEWTEPTEQTGAVSFGARVVTIMREEGIGLSDAQIIASQEEREPVATSGVLLLRASSVALVAMDLAPGDAHAPGAMGAQQGRRPPNDRPTIDPRPGDSFPSILQTQDGTEVDDAAAVWIELGKPGKFLGHPAGPFELSGEVFDEIIANFKATQNREIAVDFEHSSEADPTSGNIPIAGAPAQGWIKELKKSAGSLWGLVSWLPRTRELIRSGQYKYVSMAVRFGSRDRVTGKPIGARLTSVGLTNSPFVDGLSPITASDHASAQSFSGLTKRIMSENGCSLTDAQTEASRRLGGSR